MPTQKHDINDHGSIVHNNQEEEKTQMPNW